MKTEKQKEDTTPYVHGDLVAQMMFEGSFVLLGWSALAYDYRLMAAIIESCYDPRQAIDILKEINEKITGTNERFDGTVSSLVWLTKHDYLDPDKLTNPVLKEHVSQCLKNPETYNPCEMDFDRWSYQAMLCKATTINLALATNKLKIFRGATNLIEMLEKQTLEDLRNAGGKWGTMMNAFWLPLVANNPWHQRKDTPMADWVVENACLGAMYPTAPMGYMLKRLHSMIMRYGKKSFDDWHFHHPAFMQLWHAAVIVTYLGSGRTDATSKMQTKYEIDGMNHFLNWVLDENEGLQPWFLTYFVPEFERRLPYIKHLHEFGIPVYLPLMESSQFVPSAYTRFFPKLLPYFESTAVPLEEKNTIARSLVRNIQRGMWLKEGIKQDTSEYKTNAAEQKHDLLNATTLLVGAILSPLIRNAQRKTLDGQPYYLIKEVGTPLEVEDLVQAALFEIIVDYNPEKYPNLFGFMATAVPRKALQLGRRREIDEKQVVVDEDTLNATEESGPTTEQIVDLNLISDALKHFMENTLTPAERNALQKKINEEKGLTAAERKALERARKKATDAGLRQP